MKLYSLQFENGYMTMEIRQWPPAIGEMRIIGGEKVNLVSWFEMGDAEPFDSEDETDIEKIIRKLAGGGSI